MSRQADAHRPANPHRGEVSLTLSSGVYCLRPNFSRLVAAEEEIGSILALIDEAAKGEVKLASLGPFLWHMIEEGPEISRDEFLGEIAGPGLVAASGAYAKLLAQLLPRE